MDQHYQVVYKGSLKRGQTRSSVASRLSEVLGRDRSAFESLLDESERVILSTESEQEAKRLVNVFAEAGAEMRLQKPKKRWWKLGSSEPKKAVKSKGAKKTSVKASMGQRVWLLRAAAVLLVLVLVVALGFGLLAGALVGLLWSYSWVVSFVPLPQVLLPLYTLLFLALLLTLVSLAKPLVRIGSRLPGSIRLESDNEPDLFDFVEHVCEVIRVPVPKVLSVDMSAKVKAGWRRGSELTIGLPVVASVTATELGGLIARALTLHVGGLSGMLGRFVSSLVGWLTDTVYGRDLLDDALNRGSQSKNRPFAYVSRGVSWLLRLSRRVLGYVLKEAVGTSAAAMQSIESHKDRHHARIIGAARFDKSLRLSRVLQFAAQGTDAALLELWQKRAAPPADLPVAITKRLQALANPDMLSKVIARAESEQEPVPEFHLPDVKRIERIAKSGIEPALACGNPARVLVRGAAVLSRRLTMLHYRNRLRMQVTPAHLQPRVSADQSALDHLSGSAYLETMPVAPRRFLATDKPTSELVKRARMLSQAIPKSSEEARKSIARYKEVQQLLHATLFEESILRSKKMSTKRARDELEEVQTRCRALEESLEKAYGGMALHGDLISQRLANGIALLEQPQTASRIPQAQGLAAQAKALSEVLEKVHQQMGTLRDLVIHASLLEMLLAESTSGLNVGLKDRIAEQEADISTGLTALRVAFKRVQNPLEQKTSLFDSAHAGWVPTNTRYEMLDEVSAVLEGVWRIKGRMTVRLASLTNAVEGAWLGHTQV